MDRRERPALLARAPEIDYAPDHYLGYDSVLGRLACCTPELMRDLSAMAHSFVSRRQTTGERNHARPDRVPFSASQSSALITPVMVPRRPRVARKEH